MSKEKIKSILTHQLPVLCCKSTVIGNTGSCYEYIPYDIWNLIFKVLDALLPSNFFISQCSCKLSRSSEASSGKCHGPCCMVIQLLNCDYHLKKVKLFFLHKLPHLLSSLVSVLVIFLSALTVSYWEASTLYLFLAYFTCVPLDNLWFWKQTLWLLQIPNCCVCIITC